MQYPDYQQEISDAAPVGLPPYEESTPSKRRRPWQAVFILVTFALGMTSGYLLRGVVPAGAPGSAGVPESGLEGDATGTTSLDAQVNPPGGYVIPASFGDIGPQLLAAGAIDLDRFVQTYAQAGRPLTEEQLAILTEGSDALVVIDRENAYFLLNFFWALGLTNRNPLLDEGPIMQYAEGDVGRFASTGGWTIGQQPAAELFSSAPILSLSREQQARVEGVAYAVFRPCCNNPTAFPDCNHGMAMLGLLELMASQGATVDEMFESAKWVNAFWFPQQALETAVYFEATQGLSFAEVDARTVVSADVFSGSGFRSVHQWLADNGKLEQAPSSGGGCGV